jgi:hypothetical protein
MRPIIINFLSRTMMTIQDHDGSHVRYWEPNEVAHSCGKCQMSLGLKDFLRLLLFFFCSTSLDRGVSQHPS